MSTIAKLNPMIRQRRHERRLLRREFERKQDFRTPHGRVVIVTFQQLDILRKRSYWTGAQKERAQEWILSDFERAVEALPA